MMHILRYSLRKAVIGWKRVWHGTLDQLRWLRGLLRRRPDYIRERWAGDLAGPLDGRVCIFVHFERRGIVHAFVLYYLRALRAAGFKIVFVSNAEKLDPAGLKAVRALSHLVLRRSNVGYDFGAYKDGIAVIPDLGALDFLLLANDSVYGPFSPLADLLNKLDTSRAQFWSLTDSWERVYHLQSYFLLFGRDALRHPAFQRFWRRLRYVNSKSYVIREYEVGLTKVLMKGGLRGGALFSTRDASRHLMDRVDAGALKDPSLDVTSKGYLDWIHGVVESGGTVNISHFFWDQLIGQMGCPFLKRELLEKNPGAVPNLSRWQKVIGDISDYDTDLILQHLEMTLKNRVV